MQEQSKDSYTFVILPHRFSNLMYSSTNSFNLSQLLKKNK